MGKKKKEMEQTKEDLEEYEDAVEELEERIQTLEGQITQQTELANGYFAQLQRVQADFENYQKRIDAEKGQIADIACAEMISGLLETLDNFDRAMDSLEKVPPEDAAGVKMVYETMLSYLRNCGLERIVAAGCQFDPRKHEAIMQAESEEAKDGTVLEEFQCGYSMKGKVLRPSKVKVAKHK